MRTLETHRLLLVIWMLVGVILLLLLFTQKGYARELPCWEELTTKEKSIVQHAEKTYLRGREGGVQRYCGDLQILAGEGIDGSLEVIKGRLELAGRVEGNVLVVFGDMHLLPGALVEGDVIAVNGKVIRDPEAAVEGDVVITTMPYSADKESEKEEKAWQRTKDIDEEEDFFWADYNRVDGLTLGIRMPQSEWWARRNHHFAIIGKVGYSFAAKFWQHQIGLERWSGDEFRFAMGAEYHHLTDTEDRHLLCDWENAAAAFFIKEDFRDYYRREGFSAWVSQNFSSAMRLKAFYRRDDLTNIDKNTDWALFGKRKVFRDNPAALPLGYLAANGVDEPLAVRTVGAELTLDTRNSRKSPTRGFYLQAFGERSGKDLGSPLEFERFILDLRQYLPLNWDEHILLHVRTGSASGYLPPVYWYDLGGISTLRGYRFKEFTGDRMVSGTVEYHLRTGGRFFLGLDLILFADAGKAWFADPEAPHVQQEWPGVSEQKMLPWEGFDVLCWAQLKSDVGIGLADPDGDFRIDFARRLDRQRADFIVTFRLCRTF
ncbi:MAG: BamA/TamA family outer membrane protein [candidate division KSB1 bacterium]|nr:BamA/TamA family outer membrane protein [candidate division KSB1 bacterium]MDZ7346916.1 BamA/TamA family outer membrane protein [candidate division KSB1 bacterium]